MTQPALFDLEAARTARDDGITQVDANSDDEWRNKVDRVILVYARLYPNDFTSDDVRAYVAAEPHNPNAWGARLAHAARQGIIVKVGYRQSTRTAGHARAVAVWRGVQR